MASLFAKLHVHSMDHYLNTRYIRWAGHVARMSENRLPRRMLTAWVDNPRPRGKSHYGYGLAREGAQCRGRHHRKMRAGKRQHVSRAGHNWPQIEHPGVA